MSKIVINGDVVLKRNNATDAQGVAIPPTVESMNYGEIAINYNAKDACIFIKALDANGQQKIVKFVGEEVIAKTLGDILGESAADLATLKEMIKLFEGSSSDVLTLVKNLQTEVGLKLGKTETAADSSKLGGKVAADYWNKANSNISGVDWNASKFIVHGANGISSVVDFKADGVAKGYVGWNRTTGLMTISDNTNALQLHSNGNLMWRGYTVFNTNNANLSTIDWTCKNLNSSGAITTTGDITANYVTVKGGSFNADAPNSTGGWHRGLIFRNKDNSSVYGSVGILGNGDVPTQISIGFGSSAWSDTGVHITKDNNVGVGITAPEAKFDVSGSAIIRGNLSVGGVKPTHKFESATSGANVYAGYFYHGASANGFGLYVRAGNNADDRIATFQNRGGGNSVLFYGNNNCQFTGNVGFSTGSPIDKIHIVGGGVTLSNGQSFRIQDSTGVAKRIASLDSNNNVFIGAIDSTTANVYVRHNGINAIQITGANVANTICLNSGKVGIGTGTPSERVHIVGNNLLNGNLIMPADDTGIFFKDNRVAVVKKAGTGVHFAFSNSDSSYFSISRFSEATITPNNLAQGTLSELFRVLKSGVVEVKNNLIVKGETYTYSADGIETFEAGGGATRLADLTDVDLTGAQGNFVLYQSTDTNANGDRVWKARSDAKTWSDISGKPTTFTPVEHSHIGSTYVTTPSDRALKTDLKRIDLATNTILSLTSYTYNWTTQAIETFGFKNHHAAGVIAQEIESILPFAVQPLNDEFKAVDYIQIIPYLIAAFQELHSALQDKNIAIANTTKEYKRMYGANEKLAKRVSDLESELINLKNQIAA